MKTQEAISGWESRDLGGEDWNCKSRICPSATVVPAAKTLHAVSTHPRTRASGPAPWHWQLQSGVGRHLFRSLLPALPPRLTVSLQHSSLAAGGALLPHTGDGASVCTLIPQQTGSFSQPAGPDPALLVWHGPFLHWGH